jgi:anti-sigma regulatory factor (Ser/Thr protein kinase)
MDALLVEAELENIEAVLDFINARLDDCPPKIRHQIGVAVDEIFSNIARYAYNQSVGSVEVRIAVDGDIMIEFEDSGIAHNPLTQEEPDISLPAEERELGGLGIFIVKNIMDSVEYRRDGNKNILTCDVGNKVIAALSVGNIWHIKLPPAGLKPHLLKIHPKRK